MTGFGRSQCEFMGGKLSVEVRTLNSKGVDLSLRLPSFCKGVEPQIRSIATSRAGRGKVDIGIFVESGVESSVSSLNLDVFKHYCNEALAANSAQGLEVSSDAIFSSVVRLPDVFSTQKQTELTEEQAAVLLAAVHSAMDSLDSHRLTEGEVLVGDILHRVGLIESMSEECSGFDAERIEGVRTRLTTALDKLKGVEYDKNRLEAELIYYLEKFDITEERVRLSQHINYFREVVAEGGEVGRKLGFILQEFGREINTTGSKANNSDMQRLVVCMKDEMEKIKEQTLNIL